MDTASQKSEGPGENHSEQVEKTSLLSSKALESPRSSWICPIQGPLQEKSSLIRKCVFLTELFLL